MRAPTPPVPPLWSGEQAFWDGVFAFALSHELERDHMPQMHSAPCIAGCTADAAVEVRRKRMAQAEVDAREWWDNAREGEAEE